MLRLCWLITKLRWWRLTIEERTCRKIHLGGGDYSLRNCGLPPPPTTHCIFQGVLKNSECKISLLSVPIINNIRIFVDRFQLNKKIVSEQNHQSLCSSESIKTKLHFGNDRTKVIL